MKLPNQWLLPTDGSKYAVMATEYASKLYAQLDPKPNVVILHVISDPTGSQSRDPLNAKSEEKEKGRQLLTEAKQMFIDNSGIADTVTTMMAIGEPRKTIIEIAKSNQTDHLIMGGSDYRWRISDLLSGGVSNYVLHHLNCLITFIK